MQQNTCPRVRLFAGRDFAGQLLRFILQAVPLPCGLFLVLSQHVAHLASFYLADLLAEQVQLQNLLVQ